MASLEKHSAPCISRGGNELVAVCSTGAYEDTNTLEKPWHSVKFLELVPGLDTLCSFHCINI
jgi:hypothetical protein